MNHIFKIVWHHALCKWVAVPEFAKSQGKKNTLKKTAVAMTIAGLSFGSNVYGEDGYSLSNDEKRYSGIGREIIGAKGKDGRDGFMVIKPKAGKPGESIGSNLEIQHEEVDPKTGIVYLTYKDENGDTVIYRLEPKDKKKLTEYTVYKGRDSQNEIETVNATVVPGEGENFTVTIPKYALEMAFSPDPDMPIEVFAGDKAEGLTYPVKGNGHKITLQQVLLIKPSSAIFAITEGGKGGTGGTYTLGGSGRAGGKGGDGGTVNLTVTDINIESKLSNVTGIVGQSSGGDGGDGGDSIGAIGEHGGSGTNGGLGGNVIINVTNTNINMSGKGNTGILGSSSGGNSGDAGKGIGLVSKGGKSDTAGSGGDVFITTNNTNITLEGEWSTGILGQSVGGAGGKGGTSIGLVSLGGQGGAGGNAGNVKITSVGNISMKGENAIGIVGQSLGGGGGNGGKGFSIVNLGSQGGAGGDAGSDAGIKDPNAKSAVSITNKGMIQTRGSGGHGILAQAIGGGGGNAGFMVGLANIGGKGGAGGAAGNVIVENNNTVTISGENAHGILAQSIGGGGGTGNSQISGIFTLGADGGKGGTSGKVTINNTSSIITGDKNQKFNNSSAMIAQSIGGGGGSGSSILSLAPIVGINLGGKGGEGGNADDVYINSIGTEENQITLQTAGDQSTAVIAQSIGGNGGNAGSIMSLTTAPGILPSFAINLGGKGGLGGKAGEAKVAMEYSNIITMGDFSSGIVAQSVGGNGGQGGSIVSGAVSGLPITINMSGKGGKGGNAGKATVETTGGTIWTQGTASSGVIAQSIGGNGGNAGSIISGSLSTIGNNISVNIAGDGGEGATSAEASINNKSDISTEGSESSALVAQSIGGNGGKGGSAISAQVGAVSAGVTMSGDGGHGGVSGIAKIISIGNLLTSQANSTAVVAQSIGGSGGDSGVSISGAVSGLASLVASISGGGGAGGKSGSVSVILGEANSATQGIIGTIGDNSKGIVAQSVGGTGGNVNVAVSAAVSAGLAAASASVTLGGDGGKGGTAKDVTVKSYQDIVTEGNNSGAILAQSIGGSGGSGGMVVSGSLAGAAKGPALSASVAIGGNGGSGGNADTVSVISKGNVFTKGDFSDGIVAQSIGGDGGIGGNAIALSLSVSPKSSVGASVSLGGKGGSASYAKDVTVETDENIITKGLLSAGIVAQSIGGSGGKGGFAVAGGIVASGESAGNVSVALGGNGGQGGEAGNVTVDNKAHILTEGFGSTGILAQSIGGNGGSGGSSISGDITMSNSNNITAQVLLGGNGASGGIAKDVKVINNDASIVTKGLLASGIIGQSIGGDGGVGGMAVSGSISISAQGKPIKAGVNLGGNGGQGAAAGSVTINSYNKDIMKGNDGEDVATIWTEGALSHGILAQSIGGSGGQGGGSGDVSVTASADKGNIQLGVELGGNGGAGNESGAVTVISHDNIYTKGVGSSGIYAQSIGGDGGDGGWGFNASLSGSLSASSNFNANVALGGKGGSGGNVAKAVDVTSIGTISTVGDHSQGVLAQSIGGSGGNGGMTMNAGLTTKGNNFNVALGGEGGTGNTAGAVTATRIGNTYTTGNSSDGILVQSIGGGGGNGGMSITGSGALFNSKNFSVSVGGKGSIGGTAGIVTATNTGNIVTKGHSSKAILAQSIGGGGGNGGAAYAFGANAISTESSWTVTASIGGAGGQGNTSQTVTVTNNGILVTEGSYSQAILAQSIGGGGGNGGLSLTGVLNTDGIGKFGKSNTVNIAVGGMGGTGNSSEVVTVNQIGDIWTKGVGSSGIQAQSIGGGGGNGGNATNERLTFTCEKYCSSSGKSLGSNFALGVGGWGGSGNNAAAVKVTNDGNILTEGFSAHGIYAQSVGGGGGDGGNALLDAENFVLLKQEENEEDDPGISIGIGGYKGAGGEGGTVTVDSSGVIQTTGDHAKGILAQSIGGGGGNGGNVDGSLIGIGGGAFQQELSGTIGKLLSDDPTADGSSGNGQLVTVNTGSFANTGQASTASQIITKGNKADAIFAQSIGGGGGIGGTAQGKLALGGDGGAGGHGGAITIQNDSILLTSGRSSSGIMAQSIGGGGGTGGAADDALVAVGGSGSSGGNGGTVNIQNINSIHTQGIGSRGIYAQSIGGSGGNGGDALQSKVAIGGGALASITGVSAQAQGGNGGEVTINNLAKLSDYIILTESDLSDALMAQSIGGGGGTGGSADGVLAIGGFAASAGDGNKVTINNNLILGTKGIQSNGIVAQSIGGGGGIGGGIIANEKTTSIIAIGGNGGKAGHGKTVTVTNSAELIVTEGDLSRGIVAQSIGGGGGIGGYVIEDSKGSDIRNTIMGFGSNVLNKVSNTIGSGIGSLLLNQDAKGGDGDAVVVNNGFEQSTNSLIMTKGNGSDAILAQSIGGGGGASGSMDGLFVAGAAGAAAGKAGPVTVKNYGQLNTIGAHSNGLVAQSIGGGGGIRSGIDAIATSSSLGASSKAQGHADQVSIHNHGLIITENEFSIGMLAQSIGGGGAAIGLSETVIFGSTSDAMSNADAVTFTNTGSLSTSKVGSSAIVAQSIGGGGGLAAGAQQVGRVKGNGDSGLVMINNDSESLHTQGAFSHGIVAQSLAGGGGYANILDGKNNVIGYVAGSSGGSGNSGGVVIKHNGLILTEGTGSHGILAQSQGVQSGNINITVNADSSIIGGYGNGSAIMMNGGGNNTVHNIGLLTSLGTNIAYRLSDQQDENGIWQLVATGWTDGTIIRGDMGNNTIDNGHYMAGSMYLMGTNQTVTNRETGWLLAGNTLQLKGMVNSNGLLVNEGKLAVGSVNQVAHTRIEGDFQQDETGIYYWDYDLDRNSQMPTAAPQIGRMAQRSMLMDAPMDTMQNALPSVGSYDVLNVTGQVKMNGVLSINVMSPGKATPGVSHQVMVTAQELTDHGIELRSVPSAVAVFDKIVSQNGFTVRSEIDYSRTGLTENGHRLGDAINNIQRDQKYAAFEPIAAALFYQKDMQALQTAYDSIMGEGSVGVMQSAFSYSSRMMKVMQQQAVDWLSNTRYQNRALSADCQQSLDATTCQYNEKLRTWISFDRWSEDISNNTTIGSGAYHSTQNLSALGIDYQVDERTLLGAAISRGSSNYHVDDRATKGSLRSHGVGLYGIKTFGETYVKASMGYDYFRANTERFAIIHGTNEPIIPVATVESNLKAKFTGSVANVGVEVGTRFEFENDLNVSPFIGIQASMLKQNSATEEAVNTGDLLALNYHKKTAYSVPVFVGVQIDKTFFSPGGTLQTYARAALTHEFASRRELTANFAVAPEYNFTTRGAAARRNNVAVDVGFKVMPTKSLEMYGQFNGIYGGKTKHQGFSVGLSYKW